MPLECTEELIVCLQKIENTIKLVRFAPYLTLIVHLPKYIAAWSKEVCHSIDSRTFFQGHGIAWMCHSIDSRTFFQGHGIASLHSDDTVVVVIAVEEK